MKAKVELRPSGLQEAHTCVTMGQANQVLGQNPQQLPGLLISHHTREPQEDSQHHCCAPCIFWASMDMCWRWNKGRNRETRGDINWPPASCPLWKAQMDAASSELGMELH